MGLSVIKSLVRVVAFIDSDTGDHIYQIDISCVLIGWELSLSTEGLKRLYFSSLFHDVGKVGIHDIILLK